MPKAPESVAINAALHFVVVSDIPADHKRVLIEVLTQALREGDVAETERKSFQAEQQSWQPEELTELRSFLEGKVARSWQNADEILMRVATQLRRSPTQVRAKATELGLGFAVDYALAKVRVVPTAE